MNHTLRSVMGGYVGQIRKLQPRKHPPATATTETQKGTEAQKNLGFTHPECDLFTLRVCERGVSSHSGCVMERKTKVNNYPTPGVPGTPGILSMGWHQPSKNLKTLTFPVTSLVTQKGLPRM